MESYKEFLKSEVQEFRKSRTQIFGEGDQQGRI